jgi:hypothetical protein
MFGVVWAFCLPDELLLLLIGRLPTRNTRRVHPLIHIGLLSRLVGHLGRVVRLLSEVVGHIGRVVQPPTFTPEVREGRKKVLQECGG